MFSLRPDSAHVSREETRAAVGPNLKTEELIAGNGLRKLLAAGFSLKRLGNYDRQISRSLASMTTLHGVDVLKYRSTSLNEEPCDVASQSGGCNSPFCPERQIAIR